MKNAAFLFVFILSCNFIVAQDLNYFIKFDGIPGEYSDKIYKDWCILESFDQQLLSTAILEPRTSTFNGETITVVKKIDKASPKIMEALTKGRIIESVEINVERKIPIQRDNIVYAYRLEHVAVMKYNIKGENPEMPIEEVVLKFKALKVSYTWYKNDGQSGGVVESEYRQHP